MKALALVTGATGMLGRQVVTTLQAHGLVVRALVRPGSDVSRLASGVEPFSGSITDRQYIERACQGVNYLFHLAGYLTVDAPFGGGRPSPQYQAVNVEFTRLLLEVAQEQGVDRFVFASSSSVYAPGSPSPTGEDALLNPASHYGRSKLRAETWLATFQEQGLGTTVVRPPVIYGPVDRYFTPTALRLARLPVLPLINGGRSVFDMVYVQDVAELMWAAASSPAAVGRTYNAGSGQPQTIRDLVETYRKLTGRGPRIVNMAPWAMRLSGWLARPLVARLAPGAEAALSPSGLDLMRHDLYLDMSRAAGELAFRPRFSLEEGLALTLATLKESA